MSRPDKVFIVYDGRANGGDTESAVVMSCAKTLAEARDDALMFDCECAIYEYDLVLEDGALVATNERYVEAFRS